MSGHLIGLIGADVGGSLSPALFEAEADALGLRLLYRTVDVDPAGPAAHVGELVRMARVLGYTGLNVTHPCKQTILGQLDGLSPDAAALGAVNTVVLAGGVSVGHNTDWSGFAASVRQGLPGAPTGRVVLLGAGGAGAAVGHALLTLGVRRLVLVDVEPVRAEALARALGDRFGDARVTARPDAEAAMLDGGLDDGPVDGLVNATPIGMAAHPGLPLPVALLRPHMWVVDVIYRPLETALLRHARELGCRTRGGGGMLVHQAALGFHLLTGHVPDTARMLHHFDALIGARVGEHSG